MKIVLVLLGWLITGSCWAQTGGYDYIGKFKNGRAEVMKNGFYGIIDVDGIVVVEPIYDHIGKFKMAKL